MQCGGNGFSVATIEDLTSGTHTQPWSIPATWIGAPSTQCKIEISNEDNPSVKDASDGVFEIK